MNSLFVLEGLAGNVSNAIVCHLSMHNLHGTFMNLRHLQTFVRVADAGGFAAALPSLNLSQPAASRQIQSLEADLQVKLFDRNARGVQLTSAGEDLLRRSRALLADAAVLLERSRALKLGDTGLLRIGATTQVIQSTLAPFLRIYRRKFPRVTVELVEDGGKRLPERLRQGDVHIVLTNTLDEDLLQYALYPVCAIAVSHRAHRFGKMPTIDVSELASEQVLVLDQSFESREWLNMACARASVRPHIILESKAPHTIVALAAAKHGVAVVPSTVIVTDTRLRIAPLVHREHGVGKWLTVSSLRRRFLAPFAEAFIAELAEFCRRQQPGREFFRKLSFAPKPPTPVRENL